MSCWTAGVTAESDELIEELSERVRHRAYAIDPQEVAAALLRDVADEWRAFTEGRAHARVAPRSEVVRLPR